jgi:hypothetical protein
MNAKNSPQSLLQQIAQIQHMEPGKLCVIRQGPHGPYYNLLCRERGKTLSQYIPADQSEQVAQHTANYREFQGLVDEYAALVVAQTRQERLARSKKKTLHPKSSSPKTRKSGS